MKHQGTVNKHYRLTSPEHVEMAAEEDDKSRTNP